LSLEVKLFLTVLLLPLAVALPLITWSTIKIIGQVTARQLIDQKYIIFYGFSLIVLAAGVCFFFILEAVGSHGSDRGLFLMKCLFASAIIVAYPLIDLIIFRSSQLSNTGRSQRIRSATILSEVIILAAAVFFLIKVIGPPLNAALRLQYRSAAKTLINLGANVHKKDVYGATPLWWAVHRVDLDMATLLLDKGAKLDKEVASLGLRNAVLDKNPDMLRFLLSRGADPNSIYMGATPLVYACQQKNMTMIRILLDSGGDINFKSKYPNMPYDGKSPLDIAYGGGDPQMVELLLSHAKKR
jgi:ankyrin repeat protein